MPGKEHQSSSPTSPSLCHVVFTSAWPSDTLLGETHYFWTCRRSGSLEASAGNLIQGDTVQSECVCVCKCMPLCSLRSCKGDQTPSLCQDTQHSPPRASRLQCVIMKSAANMCLCAYNCGALMNHFKITLWNRVPCSSCYFQVCSWANKNLKTQKMLVR